MQTYEILTLDGGTSYGTYQGRTPADALAAMHRDAGYRVVVEDGALIWHDDADEVTCGGLDCWQVRRVELLAVLLAAGVPASLRRRAQIEAAITAAMPAIGITNRLWWGFPRSCMPLARWADAVARAADGVGR